MNFMLERKYIYAIKAMRERAPRDGDNRDMLGLLNAKNAMEILRNS